MGLLSRALNRLGYVSQDAATAAAEVAAQKATNEVSRAAAARFVSWGQPASPFDTDLNTSLQFAWRHPYFAACLQHIGMASMGVPLRVLRMVPDPDQKKERKRTGRYITRSTAAHCQYQYSRRPNASVADRRKRTDWLGEKGMVEEEVSDEHELVTLLDRVSPIETWPSLIYLTFYDLGAVGNCYWELPGGAEGGKPGRIDRLRPERMSVIPDPTEKVSGYILRVNGREIKFTRDEVLHFRYPHPQEDYYGLGSGATLDWPLRTDWNRFKYANTFFAKGAQLAAVLTPGKNVMMPREELKRFQEDFEEQYAGVENMGKIGYLEEGTYTELGHTPKDAEYLGMANRHDMEIGAVTGVPTQMFKAESVNRANYEAAQLQFWSDTMAPGLRFVSSMLNEFLCPRYGPDIVVDFDLSVVAVLGEAQDQIIARESQRFNDGVLTINEYRQLTGADPWPEGGDQVKRAIADKYVTPGEEEEEPEPPPAAIPPQFQQPAEEEAEEAPEEAEAEEEPEDEEAEAKIVAAAARKAVEFDSPEHRKANAAWERRLRPFEARMLEDIEAWARALRSEVIASFELEKALKASVPDVTALFDIDARGEALWGIVEGTALEAAEAGGARVLASVGLEGLTFDPEAPRVTQYFGEKRLLVKTVATDLHDDLRGIVAQGLREGQPITQIADAVGERFDGLEDWQAKRIAQTETVGAMNAGSFSGLEQSGLGAKEWLATLDDRVRDSHAAAMYEGAIPTDDRFESVGMLYPGDPAGAVGDIVNCRCSIAPALLEDVAAPVPEVPTPEPTRAPRFETTRDAEAWLQERHPGLDLRLRRMRTEVAQEVVEAFDKLAREYPEVARAIESVRVGPTTSIAESLGGAAGNPRTILIGEGSVSTEAQVARGLAKLREAEDAGFNIVRGWNEIFTHEFGHCAVSRDPEMAREIMAWGNQFFDEAAQISGNAMQDAGEFFADCLNIYRNRPRAEWPPIMEEFEVLLGRVMG